MTKDQVEREIKLLEGKRRAAWERKTSAESRRKKTIDEATESANDRIRAKADERFKPIIERARQAQDEADAAVLALKIKHAAVLAGVPVNCTLEEWRQDYGPDDKLLWVRTGRKGKAEVFLHGSEWPANKRWDKPDVGKMVVRVFGKNGKPTQVAEVLSRKDSQYRKYKWEPELKVVKRRA